jgi:hypothetical protein
MRKVALVIYCCFVAAYLSLGWWFGIVYLIVAALAAVFLHEFSRP